MLSVGIESPTVQYEAKSELASEHCAVACRYVASLTDLGGQRPNNP